MRGNSHVRFGGADRGNGPPATAAPRLGPTLQRSNGLPAVEISGDGEGVIAHVGARLLVEVADGLGLTAALGERPTQRRARRSTYDPGVVLRDVAVMLADGGDCLADLAVLRDQPELFGRVPPDETVWWYLDRVAGDDFGVDAMRAARASARRQAWEHGGVPLVDGMLIVDFDATLTTSHSDKEQAAGTYKGGYGHYPLLSYLDRRDGTGEPLAGVLRPGNAGPTPSSTTTTSSP
jgi:hypothetical protein